MQKRVGPKRVSLFEAGAGQVPRGAVKQAVRALEKREGRKFIITDKALTSREIILGSTGLAQFPKNLRLVRNCSVQVLKKLPKESQDIVFESFFLNSYVSARTEGLVKERIVKYFNEAKRVLKPNGRIILVQSLVSAKDFTEIAKKRGFKVHIVKLSDKLLEKSKAEWVRRRATPKARRQFARQYQDYYYSDFSVYLKQAADELGESKPSEVLRPVAIILRK